MKYYNPGQKDEHRLQNQFTRYLMVALKNKRASHMRTLFYLQQHEYSLEQQEVFPPELSDSYEPIHNLPILQQIENERLLGALKNSKERELYILTEHILGEKSFSELASELDIGYKAVAAIYYRTLSKIKKAMGGENE